MTLLLSFGRKAGKALLQYLDPTSWESWEEGSRELWIFSFWSFCFFLPSLQFVSLFLLYVCSKLHHIFIRFFFCNCFTIPLSLLGGLCHGVVVAWSDGPHTRTFMWSFFMHSTNSMDRELLHRGLPALVAFTGLGAAHQTGSERKGVGDWNRRNFLRMVSEYSGFFSPFFNIVSPLHITSYEKEGYGTTERLGGQGTDRQVMGSGLLERTGFSPHSLLLRW